MHGYFGYFVCSKRITKLDDSFSSTFVDKENVKDEETPQSEIDDCVHGGESNDQQPH